MLPLTSNSTAMLTPLTSFRKSAIVRAWPASSTSKSPAVRILNEPTLPIPDHGGDAHQIDARFEHRHLGVRIAKRGLTCGLTPGGRSTVQPHRQEENSCFHEELAADHQPRVIQGVCHVS
jgi:hypothetical protein